MRELAARVREHLAAHRRADQPQGARRARRQAARARHRPVDRPRPRPAVGHVGAPPRRPLRAAEDWVGPPPQLDRGRRRGAARAPLPRAASARRRAPTSPPTRAWRRASGAAARRPAPAPLPRRGRRRAARRRRAAPLPDPEHAGAGPLPADVGRDAARPRPPRADPARGAPPEDLPRRNPHSMPTFLVDGAVAGTWKHRDGRIELAPFEPLDARDAARAATPRPTASPRSTREARRLWQRPDGRLRRLVDIRASVATRSRYPDRPRAIDPRPKPRSDDAARRCPQDASRQRAIPRARQRRDRGTAGPRPAVSPA